MRVIVVGGGFGGCSAAIGARKAGAEVILLERMEVLGGWARLTGRLDHRYFPVIEELRLMGGDDIFKLMYKYILHRDVYLPWPKPSGSIKDLFHTVRFECELGKYLQAMGIEVRLQSRVTNISMDDRRIKAVLLGDGTEIQGDVFVDATGGAGPTANCQKYGQGCVMCFMRCPAFGGRVSIAAKAGVKELKGKKLDGSLGAINGAFALLKESLSPQLREQLEQKGTILIPVPSEFVADNYKRTESVTASANIGSVYAENLVLVDVGVYVKRAAGGYTPLDELRQVPGLEQAVYAEPYAGAIGNGVRFMAITPRGNALNVPGVDNLFVASEKLGVSGVGEAIVMGMISGHNAARMAAGVAPLILPRTTVLGDFIAFVNEMWHKEAGLRKRFHISSDPYMSRADRNGLHTEDKDLIASRIEQGGLINVLQQGVAS